MITSTRTFGSSAGANPRNEEMYLCAERGRVCEVAVFPPISYPSIAQRKEQRMELTYHWEGDVLIPDLELEDGSNYQIGKYGRMRQRYLFENHHAMYTHLVLTEKLWKHLEEVDMECNDMMDMLTVRMAEREGVTEHLKSVDQLGWVRKMNNIRSRAEEVVLHDLIYR